MMNNEDKWGFDQYDVLWSSKRTKFELEAFNSRFVGFYRRDGHEHIIDIYIDIMSRKPLGEEKYTLGVVCIPYDLDPREDMKSLRCDIGAAVNQWHHQKCVGGVMYEDVIRHLANPTLNINSSRELRDIVTRLTSLMTLGGEGLIKIGNTSLIVRVPENKGVQVPLIETIPTKIRKSDISQEMLNAFTKFKSSGETDAKKLRKKLRRLGWTGGLKKFINCLEEESVPQ